MEEKPEDQSVGERVTVEFIVVVGRKKCEASNLSDRLLATPTSRSVAVRSLSNSTISNSNNRSINSLESTPSDKHQHYQNKQHGAADTIA